MVVYGWRALIKTSKLFLLKFANALKKCVSNQGGVQQKNIIKYFSTVHIAIA